MVVQSFDEAMAIVDRESGFGWHPSEGPKGTWYISPRGWEDAQGYLVTAGAREWIVDRNYYYLMLPESVLEVVKATGQIVHHFSTLFPPERARAMRPVSASGAEPEALRGPASRAITRRPVAPGW